MTPIERARAAYTAAVERMHAAIAAIDAAGDDTDLTELRTEADAAIGDAERAKAQLDQAEAIERARLAHPVQPAPADTAPELRTAGTIQVTREEDVYHPASRSVFLDLTQARNGDTDARDRLIRNSLQVKDQLMERAKRAQDPAVGRRLEAESRAISQTATAGGEFIPPLWLNDQYAPLLRARRAFADQCYSQTLPDGTNSINFPKITTGASAAVQADGGAVSNTDQVTTTVTAQVQTIAGRSIASYQLVDMSQPGIDGVIYQDILGAYWQALDVALISGNVTNAKGFLNVSGINAVTYTDASPTGPELYAPMLQAKSQIDKGAFAPTQFTLWHPSTWNWYLSQLDTANRPLALATDLPSFNAMATFNPAAEGIAGNFQHLPVVVDANIPVNLGAGTNESRIGLFNRETLYLWEGVPKFKVADQTSIANLQYQFVLYGYYANAFARQPKMISVISGTGLIVQSGF